MSLGQRIAHMPPERRLRIRDLCDELPSTRESAVLGSLAAKSASAPSSLGCSGGRRRLT